MKLQQPTFIESWLYAKYCSHAFIHLALSSPQGKYCNFPDSTVRANWGTERLAPRAGSWWSNVSPLLGTHCVVFCPMLTWGLGLMTREGFNFSDFVCECWPGIRNLPSNPTLPLSSCLTFASLVVIILLSPSDVARQQGKDCDSARWPEPAGEWVLPWTVPATWKEFVSCPSSNLFTATSWYRLYNAQLFSHDLIEGISYFRKFEKRLLTNIMYRWQKCLLSKPAAAQLCPPAVRSRWAWGLRTLEEHWLSEARVRIIPPGTGRRSAQPLVCKLRAARLSVCPGHCCTHKALAVWFWTSEGVTDSSV